MTIRSMEQRIALDRAGESVEEALDALLRPEAGAAGDLLVIGGGAPPRPWTAGAVAHAESWQAAPAGPFAAVLWTAAPGAAPAAALSAVRERMVERGRLVIQLVGAAGEGAFPETRERIRRLSEAGFVLVRELPAGTAGAGPVLAARRDEFRVRPYEAGDAAALGALFTASFHAERSVAHWRWKYDENPWGGRLASVALATDGRLAVHYGGYPIPYVCDGVSLAGVHMGDTMTAAEFRRIGRGTSSLLARTVRHFFACHRYGRFAFFFGFNTGAIQRFCDWFAGAGLVEPVTYRRRDAAAPPSLATRYRVERVARAGPGFDRLFRRAAPSYGFLARRDAAYVGWRYLRCPDEEPYVVLAARRIGRLVGWGVFRRRDGRLRWGDALFHPRHSAAAAAILARALREPELAGCATLEAWFPERPAWWSDELRRLGFETAPEPQALSFMLLQDREPGPPVERLYYTMGDADLF